MRHCRWGPAIAYYAVIDRSSTRVRLVTSVLLLCGIINCQILPGHTEPYDFFVAALVFVGAAMAAVLSRRTRRAHLAEIEACAGQAESERNREASLAAARERARIARELHDVVAHHVSLMAVQAEAATSLLPGQPEAAGRSVEIIGQTARQALTELRRLLGVLRGPGEQQLETAPSPSLGDLGAVLEKVRSAGLPVELRVEGSPSASAPGVDLTAYRIVQEALTNTIRHAPAAMATVTFTYEPGYITVSVTDSVPSASFAPVASMPTPGGPAMTSARPAAAGPATAGPTAGLATAVGPRSSLSANGATAAAAGVPGPAGFGLAGIAARVASCGGTLIMGPTPAGGFTITARLPA
jgi:signal transduction histidine kinase